MHLFFRFLIYSITLYSISFGVYAKDIIGWVENVQISLDNTIIEAKIDTGASSSSLHIEHMSLYERGGEKWIKFTVTDRDGKTVIFNKKNIRDVKVKRHFGDVQRRNLVRMGICIGNKYEETDVSLIDRSGFNYSMLIGRKFLKEKFIVDPAITLTTKPNCKKVEK